MAASVLDALHRRISDEGILDDAALGDGIVYGRARFHGAGADVTVNVDPELDDVSDPDSDALIDGVERILAMTESRWTALIETVATEIEDSIADDQVVEQTDLRVDLEAASVVVFADATLLSLAAPRQFPDSRILVQLGEDFEIENVEVADGDGAETIGFASLDDLLDHISGPDAD